MPRFLSMASTVWRGRLAFGLVAIPVRLYKAARRERIRFRQIYRAAPPEPPASFFPEPEEEEEEVRAPKSPSLVRTPERPGVTRFPAPAAPPPPPPLREEEQPERVARVHRAPMPEEGGAPLANTEVLKGYELERDRYVALDPAEVAALRPRTSTELEIAEFVRPEEIDPLYYDASHYVAADRGGEKPYALLYRALKESGYAGIGALAMHGREYYAAIRAGSRGLLLHTLFHGNETGSEDEYAADVSLVADRELEMAKLLVTALAGTFDPSRLKDAFEERLKQLIASRTSAAVSAARQGPPPKAAPVADIMEALRKSLAAARKPVGAETAPVPAPAARKRPKGRAGGR